MVLKRCTGLVRCRGLPHYDESVTITLPCDNVVLSIGQCISGNNLLDGEAVQLGRGRALWPDAMTYQTFWSDIFVGGGVYTGPRFAIDAIAAGKQGAISIHRFVRPNTSLTIVPNRRDFYGLDKTNLALAIMTAHPAGRPEWMMPSTRTVSFRDAHLTDRSAGKTRNSPLPGLLVPAWWTPASAVAATFCTASVVDAIHLHRDLPECSYMVRSEDKFKAILPCMAKREVIRALGKRISKCELGICVPHHPRWRMWPNSSRCPHPAGNTASGRRSFRRGGSYLQDAAEMSRRPSEILPGAALTVGEIAIYLCETCGQRYPTVPHGRTCPLTVKPPYPPAAGQRDDQEVEAVEAEHPSFRLRKIPR